MVKISELYFANEIIHIDTNNFKKKYIFFSSKSRSRLTGYCQLIRVHQTIRIEIFKKK